MYDIGEFFFFLFFSFSMKWTLEVLENSSSYSRIQPALQQIPAHSTLELYL